MLFISLLTANITFLRYLKEQIIEIIPAFVSENDSACSRSHDKEKYQEKTERPYVVKPQSRRKYGKGRRFGFPENSLVFDNSLSLWDYYQSFRGVHLEQLWEINFQKSTQSYQKKHLQNQFCKQLQTASVNPFGTTRPIWRYQKLEGIFPRNTPRIFYVEKARRNDPFHVVSTRNIRGVFLGLSQIFC